MKKIFIAVAAFILCTGAVSLAQNPVVMKAMEDELTTEQIFLDILKDGVERGDFQCPDVELVAALIKAVLQDWYLKRWKYKRKGITVEDFGRFVVDFVMSRLTWKG